MVPQIPRHPRKEKAIMSQIIKKKKMKGISHWFLVVIFLTVAWLAILLIQGQEAYGETKKDKVKLTGAELQERLSNYGIAAGVNHRDNTVWIIVNHGNGKRDLFWRSLVKSGLWMTMSGTARVVEDQLCSKWTFGPERCFDAYRIGEDKYESWLSGSLSSTYYGVQRAKGETKEDKVKLTGAELQEQFLTPSLNAGITYRTNSVWILWTYEGGKREVYWQSLSKPGVSGADTTTANVVEDQLCSKWSFGPERCYDIYRTGENTYDGWLHGKLDFTYYRLK